MIVALSPAEVLEAIADGVDHGLPCPTGIWPRVEWRALELRFADNDAEAVERWAEHLGVSSSLAHGDVFERDVEGRRPWRQYGAGRGTHRANWRGWTVELWAKIETAEDSESAG